MQVIWVNNKVNYVTKFVHVIMNEIMSDRQALNYA